MILLIFIFYELSEIPLYMKYAFYIYQKFIQVQNVCTSMVQSLWQV